MVARPEQIALIFAGVTFLLSGVSLVSLFMMLPNQLQSRITSNDRAGYGIAALGMMVGLFSVLFATKIFNPSIGIFDLSSYFAQITAMFSGALVFMGVTIALSDDITDPFLDSKNIKWLVGAVTVILLIIVLIVK